MSPVRTTSRPRHELKTPLVIVLAAAALVIAAIALVAGCGSTSTGSSSSASPGASGSAPQDLRIAYQLIPNGDLIVKDQGWLEKALPDTKIEWVKFDSSADVNEAISAGKVDIGLVGSTSVAAGLSKPMDIAYSVAWIYDLIGAAEALAVKNDAGITDFDGLVGKKVGTPVGSTAHYSLLAALELNGVDPTEITIVDLPPSDILAAWQAGDIDAAYVGNPTLAELKKDGTVLTTSADLAAEGRSTAHLAVVTTAFSKANPKTVQTWLDQQNKAVQLYVSDPQAAADAVGRELDISGADALAQMKELILLNVARQAEADNLGLPDAPGLLADDLRSTAQFLKTQGAVEGVPPLSQFQAALANQYVAQAAGM
jgi:taurine transport system substrate-binding protein